MNDAGKRIKNLRLKLKLSQKRFGTKIGITGKSVSAYETGKAVPSYKVMEEISNVYKTTLITSISNTNILSKIDNIKMQINELEDFIQQQLTF